MPIRKRINKRMKKDMFMRFTLIIMIMVLKVDILKIGHHGSNTSTSLPFLQETKPKIAVISVGEKNRYNHPSVEVIKRLTKENIPYLQTKTSGTITILPNTKEVMEEKKEG